MERDLPILFLMMKSFMVVETPGLVSKLSAKCFWLLPLIVKRLKWMILLLNYILIIKIKT